MSCYLVLARYAMLNENLFDFRDYLFLWSADPKERHLMPFSSRVQKASAWNRSKGLMCRGIYQMEEQPDEVRTCFGAQTVQTSPSCDTNIYYIWADFKISYCLDSKR